MDVTFLLAQLWGPVLLVIGIGMFVSRPFYEKLYQGIEGEPLAALTFSIVAVAAGIVHVNLHNAWDTLPQVIVSLLGWGLLVKGALFAIAPGVASRSSNCFMSKGLVSASALLVLIVGVYLTYISYVA